MADETTTVTENEEIGVDIDDTGNLVMEAGIETLSEFYIDSNGNLVWHPADENEESPDGLPVVRMQFVDQVSGARTDIHTRTCASAVRCKNGYTLQEILDAMLASIQRLSGEA